MPHDEFPPGILYDQLPANIPELYHYSTSAGLKGIVECKQLWLSHLAYLNDAQEYSYGLNLIHKVMEDTYDPLFRVDARDKSFSSAFSVSLTQEGNLLSQWRGYCPNGGYSFAFDKEQLNALLRFETPEPDLYGNGIKGQLRIGKCIYNEAEQIKYIKSRLAGILPPLKRQQEKEYHIQGQDYYIAWQRYNECEEQLRRLTPRRDSDPPLMPEEQEQIQQLEGELQQLKDEHSYFIPARSPQRDLMNTLDDLRRAIPEMCTLLKHPSFEAEQEWRIVYKNHSYARYPLTALYDANVEFREGKSTLIPYIKIPLATEKDRVRLTKVFVSPGPQQELAKIACQAFLSRYTSNPVEVEKSDIPFRNW